MSWTDIKLSGFADEIDMNLDVQIEAFKKLNINYIEMRFVNGKNLVSHDMETVGEIKKKLDSEGLRLSAIGSPIGKIGIEDDFMPHMELFKHTVEVAHALDVPNIRMFSFNMPDGKNINSYKNEVIEKLGTLKDYGKSNGAVLLHENEKGIYGDVASRCYDIMECLYDDHFKMVFDFANFVQCGQNALDAYNLLQPYIHYVHVKDALFENQSVVPAGEGDGQVKEILSKLKNNGYEGFLSLEPHLIDFSGFKELEKDGLKKTKKLSGEEAFGLAHSALMGILETL